MNIRSVLFMLMFFLGGSFIQELKASDNELNRGNRSVLFIDIGVLVHGDSPKSIEGAELRKLRNIFYEQHNLACRVYQEISCKMGTLYADREEQQKKSTELNDLWGQLTKIYSEYSQQLEQCQHQLSEKCMIVAKEIAKQRNAIAILPALLLVSGDYGFAIVESDCDITQQVVDQLNKAYLAEKPVLPTLPASFTAFVNKLTSLANPHKEPLKTPEDMLRRAITDNSFEEVKQAVEAGVDVNKDFNGQSPLMTAVLFKSSKAVEGLLEFGAKDSNLQKIIESAVNLKDIRSAVLIEKKYGRLNTLYLGDSLLNHALLTGDFVSALALIKNGADFSRKVKGFNHSSEEREAMYIAIACSGNGGINGACALEIVQELINRGYNINNVWTLEYGEIVHRIDALKLVLKNGANPNYVFSLTARFAVVVPGSTWTPLILAIFLDNQTSVKYLLDHGADINQQASPNIKYSNQQILGLQTPLSIAISMGRDNIVKMLVEYGAKR